MTVRHDIVSWHLTMILSVFDLSAHWVVYQLAAGNSTDPRIRYNGSPLHHDGVAQRFLQKRP